jgi:hypothetical protein
MNKLPPRSQSFIIKNAKRPSGSHISIKLPFAPVLKQVSSVKVYKLGPKSILAGSPNKTLGIISRNPEQAKLSTHQPTKEDLDSVKFQSNQENPMNIPSSNNSICKEKLIACIINLKQLETENNSLKTKLNPILIALNEVVLQLEHEFTLATNFNQMLKKLENLSKENIELFTKTEKYKSQISSIKYSKNFNENVLRNEKLVQEIAEKNECIDRYEEEIRELKRREMKILKKLDRKVYNCTDKTLADTDESPVINNSRCEFRKYSIPALKLPQ